MLRSWRVGRGIPAMSVSFEALVHRPDEILPQLAGSLGVTDKVSACAPVLIQPCIVRGKQSRPRIDYGSRSAADADETIH